MNDPAISDTPVVRVSGGLIRGARIDGVFRFLGVPYAASAVGEASASRTGWSRSSEMR